jgi:ABC-type antimicrobial peptide transport system permease subunit
MIANAYLYQQLMNQNDYPFCMDRSEYGETIRYYVPENVDVEKFNQYVTEVVKEYPDLACEISEWYWLDEIKPFRKGEFISIEPGYVDFDGLRAINAKVLEKYAGQDVHRVFNNAFGYYTSDQTSFISVHFEDLDKIREFEEYVHKEFGIRIEMSQINAKENFNAVSTMANILSWAIIIFAIVCIILFIVNLLQSYFQKVKRNLGTFKAFGMGNYELISVYTLIMAATILTSIFISLVAVWLAQGVLDVLNVTRDDIFGYLSLWSGKTVSAIVVIIFASVYTVYSVMHRLLRSTPGDLIYDR